ncbi:nucleotide-sugar transporter-domain-containing protein [Gongronella butleri]|nr:nucleotide-sugar transporter-domain-containing protein [Gongronella butleri]
MRQSRVAREATGTGQDDDGLYFASTAVVMTELVKMMVCMAMLRRQQPHVALPQLIYSSIYTKDTLWMLIPAGLYAIQNNLLYIALSHLEAATFQVTYQLKILSTALCSMLLLQTRLETRQWLALVFLMIGVALVQWAPIDARADDAQLDASSSFEKAAAAPAAENVSSSWTGLIAVLLSCVSSGFAGCYFEMILKKRSARTSLWGRNMQLGVCTLVFAMFAMFANDGARIARHGFFYSYRGTTWLVIANQALGGISVSMVMKYADNILKAFATSVSIIVSSLLEVILFDFRPNVSFLLGTALVLAATYLYGLPTATIVKPD